MHPFPLFLEFLGTTEMLVIAVVALIVFGPRRLPEIGRTIGKHLAEFRRASEDFRRTWEREVEVERITHDVRVDKEVGAMLSEVNDAVAASVARDTHTADATQTVDAGAADGPTAAHAETDARTDATRD
ncbi:MAG TPA: twin-arginine translocase TatA/TatE family subunit [Pyrinomonadaceae bacterium]|nr:twin-arginine translocase TatA/TatE family subunit [Pyrinomonadaceae bacterium]